MTLEYVKTEDGKGIKMNDKGMPLYIDSDKPEEENAIDAFHLIAKVPALQGDLKKKRKEVSDLKNIQKTLEDLKIDVSSVDTLKDEITNLKSVSSILEENKINTTELSDFLAKSNDAFQKIEGLSKGELKTAKEIDKMKKQLAEDLTKNFTKKENEYKKSLEEITKNNQELTSKIYQLMVNDKFNSSKYVSDKMNRSPRETRKLFGNNFKVEKTETGDLRVFGYINGEKINSIEKPGEYAGFEESLKIMVEKDPDKDSMLKGSGKGGTGGGGSSLSDGSLKAQYDEAIKKHDIVTAISLKRMMKNQN